MTFRQKVVHSTNVQILSAIKCTKLENSLCVTKNNESVVAKHFLPICEFVFSNRDLHQNSLVASVTVFKTFANRFYSLSRRFVVRNPSVNGIH